MNFFRRNKNRIYLSTDDKIVMIFSHIIIISLAFICFYPFWYVVINSIATKDAIARGVLIFPRFEDLYFDTYQKVLSSPRIYSGALVSSVRVIIQVITGVVFSSMFAFLMTREKMKYRKFVYRFAIISMYVNGGLIPTYLLYRTYGLMNTFHVYWVPGVLGVFSVILIKTYMETIPGEIEESARIDGAGFLVVFFQIIMPLCKPILATVALFIAVGAWNSYFDNYLFVTDANLQTIQMELFNYIKEADMMANLMRRLAQVGGVSLYTIEEANKISSDAVRNTTTIITMIPILCVYPFLQKYFQSGILLGAVKG